MGVRIDDFKALKEMTDAGSLTVIDGIPAEAGVFRPQGGMMTFGEQVHHLSSVERYIAAKIIDGLALPLTRPEADAASPLDGLRGNLRETLRMTQELLNHLQDSSLDRMVPLGGGRERSVRYLLQVMVEHQVHHRGQMVVYFRTMGTEPPRRWID